MRTTVSLASPSKIFLFCILFFLSIVVWSSTYVLSAQEDLIGGIQAIHPQSGETLLEVGLRYDMGYYEMARANPHIDLAATLFEHNQIIIPSQFILPAAPRKGIVINLAEYRLYYFPPDDNVVITMPVGIGRKGWQTPIGQTKVVSKERNPVWHPSAKLQAEAAKHGTLLPNEFPAGEDNPLGKHLLRLGWSTYLIHGTNRPEGVGAQVSAGCIRMLPEDIEYLFNHVTVGTSVLVVNQPVKFGYLDNRLYVEIHPALGGHVSQNLAQLTKERLTRLSLKGINYKVLQNELNKPTGLPKRLT
ncbi:L,D-transpeptidase [Legionella jordanis]|uniref:L,D-transpeptidase family protein n=1 Tax=Legionella jordanis TaxID=456 RepID=UPI000EFFFF12|nr:L,D-transpeptidase family protein [Legionella jordanis]RMX18238.1 L,D-transpeptidase [Legionella jordanis]